MSDEQKQEKKTEKVIVLGRFKDEDGKLHIPLDIEEHPNAEPEVISITKTLYQKLHKNKVVSKDF